LVGSYRVKNFNAVTHCSSPVEKYYIFKSVSCLPYMC
jgi:hypothetical protein